MLDTKPGVYTQYQPFLQKDKTILKKVVKGMQTKRPGEVQSALLRRHLLELTQSFMIPLERYMGTLMPLQKNISPYKVKAKLSYKCCLNRIRGKLLLQNQQCFQYHWGLKNCLFIYLFIQGDSDNVTGTF